MLYKLIIFLIIIYGEAKSSCTSIQNLFESDGGLKVDRCVKAEKDSLPDIYRWVVSKENLFRENDRISGNSVTNLYQISAESKDDPFYQSRIFMPELQSSKVPMGRCNMLYNMPYMFYTEINIYGNPDRNGDTEKNLNDYFSLFDGLDTNDKRKEVAGLKNNRHKRMYDSADLNASNSQEKKSTCSGFGMCVCEKGTSCTAVTSLLSRAESINLGANNFKTAVIDPDAFKDIYSKVGTDSTLDKMKNTCYQIHPCREDGDQSPKALCLDNESDSSRCDSVIDKCLYTAACKLPMNEAGYTMGSLPICRYGFECGSGYCQKLPLDIINRMDLSLPSNITQNEDIGVCLPHAICAPSCIEEGEALSSNQDYCCGGLVNIDGECVRKQKIVLEPPEFFIEEDQDNCKFELTTLGSICYGAEHWGTEEACNSHYSYGSDNNCWVNYERDSSVSEEDCFGGVWIGEAEQIAIKYFYYTRLFETLQWLWGTANSPGVNDLFTVYQNINNLGQKFGKVLGESQDFFYAAVDEFKNDFAVANSSAGSAAGVAALKSMGDLYESLSQLDELKSNQFFEISGAEAFNSSTSTLSLSEIYNDTSFTNLGTKTDQLNGGGIANWDNETLYGLLRKVNTRRSLDNSQTISRYNAHGGNKDCGTPRRELGTPSRRCTFYEDEKTHNARCTWNIMEAKVLDGDCIQEGWRIDGGVDPHGETGKGGLVDPIYPNSLNSSVNRLFFKSLRQKIGGLLIPEISAGGVVDWIVGRERIWTGVGNKEASPISSGLLLSRIIRDYTRFANEKVTMQTYCAGTERKQVPGSLKLPEAYLMATSTENYVKTKEEFEQEVYANLSEAQKREKFIELSSKIVMGFFTRFHYHDFDGPKKTYRFYRDGENYGELGGVIELINAASWLSAFHEKNSELNLKLSQCLKDKAAQLEESLGTSEGEGLDDNEGELNQGSSANELLNSLAGDFSGCASGGGAGAGGGIAGSGQVLIDGANLQDVNVNNGAKGAKANVKGVSTVNIGRSSGESALADTGSSSSESLEGLSPGERLSSDPNFARISGARKSHNAKLSSIAKKKRLLLASSKDKDDNGKRILEEILAKISPTQNIHQKSALLTSLGNKNYGQTLVTPLNAKSLPKKIKTSSSDTSKKQSKKTSDLMESPGATRPSFSLGSFGEPEQQTEENVEMQRLLKESKINGHKYEKNPGDGLFVIISKTYVRAGIPKLLQKKKKKFSKKLPSLNPKKYEAKKKWID